MGKRKTGAEKKKSFLERDYVKHSLRNLEAIRGAFYITKTALKNLIKDGKLNESDLNKEIDRLTAEKFPGLEDVKVLLPEKKEVDNVDKK